MHRSFLTSIVWVVATVLLICNRDSSSLRIRDAIHLPPPRMLCVPHDSSMTEGCYKLIITNLHAIPEENRVVFLLNRVDYAIPHPLRFTPKDHWQCHFGWGVSTPIQYLYPHTHYFYWELIGQYNNIALAQCDLPRRARVLLLKGKSIDIEVTVNAVTKTGENAKKSFQYSLRAQRWKRKMLLGVCLR